MLPDMLGLDVGLVGVGVNVLFVEEKDVWIPWGAMWLVEKNPRLSPRKRCEFSDRFRNLIRLALFRGPLRANYVRHPCPFSRPEACNVLGLLKHRRYQNTVFHQPARATFAQIRQPIATLVSASRRRTLVGNLLVQSNPPPLVSSALLLTNRLNPKLVNRLHLT
ncbi:MAG: hypothetical protein AVDCRST_MAG37-1227 [uncultured Rubrobacteraceae bacterium]|uniref:Uncharacterized protein n=1 Tax=uncultured Rubrobacteraceae bacterium TaxID=349277 RepID=A0A6J4QC26_9ACTN|nr:MAG: hypothetical protein AVDCRST_MAG37-1227 [uncultured Rubrobacteraceae bacterium]